MTPSSLTMKAVRAATLLSTLLSLASANADAAERRTSAGRTLSPEQAALAAEVKGKGWIVYTARGENGTRDLFLSRPDGSQQRNLTDTPDFEEYVPRFSPDGRRLMYRRLPRSEGIDPTYGDVGRLVISKADGRDVKVIGEEGQFAWSSWSPDGRQFAYLSKQGVNIHDVDSRKLVRTLPRSGIYMSLFWSPDGQSFCGVANHAGEFWTVVRVDATTGQANPVRSFQNCTPNWFPDSQHIVFSSRPAGQQDAYGSTQLWMARSDGTEARLVYGEDGRHIYGGALSPDGRYVIFSNFPADGDWYRTPQCAPMCLMRLADTPAIGGESPDLRSRHANTKDGPRLPLADGWLPNWTYADIPTAESIEIGERREPLRKVAVRDVAAAFERQRKRPIGFEGSGTLGAVGAGDARGVAAGLASLECGGNAADAAACVLLTECVSDYGFLAIGAEASLMSYNVERRQTRTFAGIGGAPLDPKAIAWYYENGIPADGHVKAAPTPGIVSLLVTTLQEDGSMSFEEIAAPVLVLLDEGKETWHPNLAKTVRRLIDAEQRAAGGRIAKLQAVHDRFYKGDIAEELAAYYEHQGSFLRKADLAAHRTHVEDPVSVDYQGYTVAKCGPWTQGPCLCQALKLLEGFDLPAMGHLSVDYIHVVAEAIKLAMADRDEYYGDPRFVPVPLRQLLSEDYATIRRPLIDMARASTEFRPGDPIHLRPLKGPGTPEPGPKGTTTCVVADRWGNVVAATPSGNGPYAVCQELGVAHGNRLRSLNTRRGHPNCLEPGKRPRITLTPTLVFKDGKPIGAVSVAGGDQQDQTTLNVLLNLVHFGMTPAQAVSAPRFASSHHENSFKPYPDRTRARVGTATLTVQTNLPPEVCHQLAQRGHKLDKVKPPIAMPSLLWIDPVTRVISVAGDSHAGRHAAALSAP